MICKVNKGKTVCREILSSQGHVARYEKETGRCHECKEDQSCFIWVFLFLSTSDCCPKRSRVEREVSSHRTPSRQCSWSKQLCLALRCLKLLWAWNREWRKMEPICGTEETSLPKLLGACGG